ncbi:MAG: hypothetical protein OXM61_06565 [Candidatus Poribacteria bacterium]|nr:hypothetical protein [Candidatus Poribacteria bacterium]
MPHGECLNGIHTRRMPKSAFGVDLDRCLQACGVDLGERLQAPNAIRAFGVDSVHTVDFLIWIPDYFTRLINYHLTKQ